MTAQVTTHPSQRELQGNADARAKVASRALAWPFVAACVVFLGTARTSRALWPDAFYDLYAGRYVAAHGIPQHNVLTAAAHGARWIDQQWLGQVLYYWAWKIGGYPALALLSVMLVSAGFFVLARLMLRRGVSVTSTLAWTLAGFAVSYGYAVPRVQSFGYLFFPLLLWLVVVDNDAPRPRRLTWLAIPLLVMWANIHGSVLMGAGLISAYAGYRVLRAVLKHEHHCIAAYLMLGTASVAAVFCTPYGPGVIKYYRSLIGNPLLARNVAEWGPPNPLNPICWAFFAVAAIAVATVIISWRRGRRPDSLLLAIAAGTLALAGLALRNDVWFGFAGCLLVADILPHGPRPQAFRRPFTLAVAAVMAGAAVASTIVLAREPVATYESMLPRRAISVAATIASRSKGARIISDVYGSDGMLWLKPTLFGRVAFDTRLEQYTRTQLRTDLTFLYARPGWQRATIGYSIIVVTPGQSDPTLVRDVTHLRGWRVVFSDRQGVVAVRTGLAQPRSDTGRSAP